MRELREMEKKTEAETETGGLRRAIMQLLEKADREQLKTILTFVLRLMRK